MFDWNDLRYFLAVARAGSTLAASRSLKVSQATVSRRIGVLETAVGTPLFVRKPSGYTLTPRGTAVLASAESVEGAVQTFSDTIAAESRRLTGVVRLTTVEAAANRWIIPALPAFNARYPDIRIEIDSSTEHLNLLRGEAEIALRFSSKPLDESLIARQLMQLEETVYASAALAAQIGMPKTVADLVTYPFILYTGDGPAMLDEWVEEAVPGAVVAHRASSVFGVIAGIKAGLGVSVLPCLLGDDEPGLVRLLPPIPELTTPGWLITTDAARRQPHVRAVIDFLVETIQAAMAARTARQGAAEAA